MRIAPAPLPWPGRGPPPAIPPAPWELPLSRLDPLLTELGVRHQCDVPLAPHTWYGLGGPARVLAHPAGVAQLSALLQRCRARGVRVCILGAGANLLVADAGVDAVVVKLDDPCFRQVRMDGTIVTVGAGYDLPKLVLDTARAGLSGLEGLAGIPATVGGAIRMNAGGAYGVIGPHVRRLTLCDHDGVVHTRQRDSLVFSYRKSNIDAQVILEAVLELTAADPARCLAQVKKLMLQKADRQPLGAHSAGCAFKNPAPGNRGNAGNAHNPANAGPEAGATAGQLLDRAGLKGFRIGGAEISTVHANFVVAHPGCTAADILAVMDHAQRTVQAKFGVALEREVVVWK